MALINNIGDKIRDAFQRSQQYKQTQIAPPPVAPPPTKIRKSSGATPPPPAQNVLPPGNAPTRTRKSSGAPKPTTQAPKMSRGQRIPGSEAPKMSRGQRVLGSEIVPQSSVPGFVPPTIQTGGIAPGQLTPPSGTPFGSDRPGEGRLYEGARAPINSVFNTLTQQFRGLPTTEQVRSDIFGGGLPQQLQQAFGTTPEARGEFMNIAQQLLAPQRQESQAALQNQAAATGIGGGRLGRALAQQQRDFGQQDLGITQQLLGRELDAQSQIGNTLSNLFGSEMQGRRGEALNILGQLSPLAISQSQLPAQILQAFKSPAQ